MLERGAPMATTPLVLSETWRLVAYRTSYGQAESLVEGIIEKSTIIWPIDSDLDKAQLIGKKYTDQEFSLVDRVSFAVMERLGLTRVATFDRDFFIYRFGPKDKYHFELA